MLISSAVAAAAARGKLSHCIEELFFRGDSSSRAARRGLAGAKQQLCCAHSNARSIPGLASANCRPAILFGGGYTEDTAFYWAVALHYFVPKQAKVCCSFEFAKCVYAILCQPGPSSSGVVGISNGLSFERQLA
eukprot:6212227-Pleurochrysis_carterae.AAC.6